MVKKLCLLSVVAQLPSLVTASFENHVGQFGRTQNSVFTTDGSDCVPGDTPGISNCTVGVPMVSAGTFPFPKEFRNPEDAWDGSGKAIFLACCLAFWVCFYLIVAYWDKIKSALTGCTATRRVAASERTEQLLPPSAVPLGDGPAAPEQNKGPNTPYPSESGVHELFEEKAKSTPNAVGLVMPRGSTGTPDAPRVEVKYEALSRMSEEFAKGLASAGAGRGSMVALMLPRSVGQVVAMFGTMKAGATVLPLDAEAPRSRKTELLKESKPAVVVAESADEAVINLITEMQFPLLTIFPHGGLGEIENFRGTATPWSGAVKSVGTDNALIIYTSGTSGTPKGIVYPHKFLTHSVYFFGHLCGMDTQTVSLLKSPYYWGAMVWDYFPALCYGGVLCVASATGHKNPEYLVKSVHDEGVNVLMVTPSVLDLLLQLHIGQKSVAPLKSVKHIVTIGEPLSCELANRFVKAPNVGKLHNAYAATETSTCVYHVPTTGVNLTFFPNKVPVGTPEAHSSVYLMKEELQEAGKAPILTPVPTGEPGEICFGGMLAGGYFKRDELTAEKFLQTEQYGRLYRTGDMGRWRDGVVEVMGRNDRQVKVHGVRIEPEEIEVVLNRMQAPEAALGGDLEAGSAGSAENLAIGKCVVVGTPEPVELVAYCAMRAGVNGVTPELLKEHCKASLTPAYVPKFFVIVPEVPMLASGKPDFKTLREMAAKHASEAGSLVMDSLGQMKMLSQWAILENQVIHRCYAFWMLGVVIDHYNRCALDSDTLGNLLPFCTPIAEAGVKPWTEILIKGFGNDQTMFGFIMLGAYQDSRPARKGDKPRVKLGLQDLFIFVVYLMMALPFAQILHGIFGSWAWPHTWNGATPPDNVWGNDFMQINSFTSDHRWYLLMVLEAKVAMWIAQKLCMPGWLQSIVFFIPCLLSGVLPTEALDMCSPDASVFGIVPPTAVKYVFAWVFRTFGNQCPVYLAWVQWYLVFYVWAFHFMRPLVEILAKWVPKGAHWAAAAMGTSWMLGIIMAMYHYPNKCLETGTLTAWAPIEMGVDIIQPSLFAFAMAYFPFDMAWWGNSTLGCYCFHFYFKDSMNLVFSQYGRSLSWDPTGLATYVSIVATCMLYTSVCGPFGHYVLISPQLIQRILQKRRRAGGRK